MPELRHTRHLLHHAILRHRRLIAAALVASSVLLALRALDDRAASVPVVVAAEEIALGGVLSAEDVTLRDFPAHLVPDGSHGDPSAVVGRRVAGRLLAGEPVTRGRLLDTRATDGLPPGRVVAAVPLDEASQLAAVAPGETVDVLATEVGAEARVSVRGALVVGVSSQGSERFERSVVHLAVEPDDAARLATLAPHAAFFVVLAAPDI